MANSCGVKFLTILHYRPRLSIGGEKLILRGEGLFRILNLCSLYELNSPEHHPDASQDRQIITTYPDRQTRMGTIARNSDDSWTIELLDKRWTFESEQACMFSMMGFEEGTGRPPRVKTLQQFLTIYAPEDQEKAFRLGKELGKSFVLSEHSDENPAEDDEPLSTEDDEPLSDRPSKMHVFCNFGPWQTLRGNELVRIFDFTNLYGPGTKTKIELRCRFFVEQVVQPTPKLSFRELTRDTRVTPFFYLIFHPSLIEQTTIVAVIFAPTGEVLDYDILGARLEKPHDGNVSFLVFDPSDADKLVTVLMLGREITLRILHRRHSFEWLRAALTEDNAPDSEECISPFVTLPNDLSFKREYEKLKNELMSGP